MVCRDKYPVPDTGGSRQRLGYALGHPLGLGFLPFLAAIKYEVLKGHRWAQECYFSNKMHILRNADGSSELHRWDWGSGEERQAGAVGGARHDVIPERASLERWRDYC